jgi:hypothetical protein
MSEPGLTAKLVQLVEHYLSMHLHDNAVFMAERLVAVAPSEANRHLLATVLVAAGRTARACAVLRGSRSPANVYLLARYCIATGKFSEAESVLLEAAGLVGRDVDSQVAILQSRPYLLPNGAAGAFLLGWACHKAGRLDAAAKYYLLCVFLDPFNFAAYESLCKLGFYPHPAQAFSATRLTGSGGYSDKPSTLPPQLAPPGGKARVGGGGPEESSGLVVPSPLLSPITPAAKLLLLSPTAGGHEPPPTTALPPPLPAVAVPPVPPQQAAAATPVPTRTQAGAGAQRGATAAVRTDSLRFPPPSASSALRAHPALAASLAAGVDSADRFGYSGFDALGSLSAISPVPPDFQNDSTGLWSRVIGMSMAPPSAAAAGRTHGAGISRGGGLGLFALRSGGAGGDPSTDDFIRRPPREPDSAEVPASAAMTSAFDTPAAALGGARGLRFTRAGGGVTSTASAATGATAISATSAVRPFLLPPGSAATAAPAASRGLRAGHEPTVGPPLHAAAAAAAAAPGEEDAAMGQQSMGAADFTGLSSISMGDGEEAAAWEGATPAAASGRGGAGGGRVRTGPLFVPGPAGIIMAGKRKARADVADLSAIAPATGAAQPSALETQPHPPTVSTAASTAARPKSKRLSFSGVPGTGSSGSHADLAPHHQTPAASRTRTAGAAAAAAATAAVQSPLRRLRSHSEVLLTSAAGGGASGESAAPASTNRGSPAFGASAKAGSGKPLMRAASARHVSTASKGGDDGTATKGPKGNPVVIDAVPTAPAFAPRAPSMEGLLVHGAHELLGLLRQMAFAVRHMAKYECESVLVTLAQLPRAQSESPWALGLRGRARFELGQHAEASACRSSQNRVRFKCVRVTYARAARRPLYSIVFCRPALHSA